MARSLARIFLAVLMVAVAAAEDSVREAETAADLVRQVFDSCLQQGSMSCVRPRVLAFLSQASKGDGAIRITRDLSIVPSGGQHAVMDSNDLDNGVGSQGVDSLLSLPSDAAGRREALRHLLLERVDRFLQSHDLRVTVPRELTADGLVPRAVIDALPKEIRMPLDPEREDDAGSARHRRRRGFLKKVVLPFILGLKFKTTALIPLALSLIALKTWKALTLGLLSLVLSGAMVIFRFTKPKVVNYDVYHYPQSHGHYEHHIDHHAGYDHGHYDHYDHHHSYARSDEPDSVAYSAHQP